MMDVDDDDDVFDAVMIAFADVVRGYKVNSRHNHNMVCSSYCRRRVEVSVIVLFRTPYGVSTDAVCIVL